MANSPKKIFLVDDDKNNTDMLKMHLSKKFNLEILTFSTGEDCLNNLGLNPQYIVLDYQLNTVQKDAANGIEILKKIKAAMPDVYVIFLSGQDKIEVAVDTVKYGAYDYVVKNQSSFLRLENCLINIHKNLKLQRSNKTYKYSTFILAAVIVLIIITAIVLVKMGVATNSPSWL